MARICSTPGWRYDFSSTRQPPEKRYHVQAMAEKARFEPDFIVRLKGERPVHSILETKGYDPRKQEKKAAAERWVRAVNADGSHGPWHYEMVGKLEEIPAAIDRACGAAPPSGSRR